MSKTQGQSLVRFSSVVGGCAPAGKYGAGVVYSVAGAVAMAGVFMLARVHPQLAKDKGSND